MGATVKICDARGKFLAYGAYSPNSQIRVRVWTWQPDEEIAPAFFRARIQAALNYRAALPTPETNARRLIHAESDGLPGLVVDQYADTLVIQALSAGPERWLATIADLLVALTGIPNLYERSDADVRQLEGLPLRTGPLRGAPPTETIILENGIIYKVNLAGGHKTGFYADQAENRLAVRQLAAEKDVLDCFAYTGGFTLNALLGGAKSVTALDASVDALDLARENLTLNRLPAENVTWMAADVFQQLRKFRDQAQQFDLIILDPPKFAPTSAQVKKASRGYKDINLLAFKLLRPGGILVTFSCSGGISADLFQKIVAGAALDAGVHARLMQHLHQGADHPVGLNFPEGAYLKGLILQIER